MNQMPEEKQLKQKITDALQKKISQITALSGGCTAHAWLVETDKHKRYFIKSGATTFHEETRGLKAIADTHCIQTPNVIRTSSDLLILEYIEPGLPSKKVFYNFGKQLANMHKIPQAFFGFDENNYIGHTKQINTPSSNWIEFFYEHRLLFQLKEAERNKISTKELRQGIIKLESKLPKILAGSEESPALIHGDLWKGNFIIDQNEQAYLIDPAAYYGHREAEMALTTWIPGFSPEFYQGYNATYPLKPGYKQREKVYQLYHVINHMNLFYGNYYPEALDILDGLT
jgi:protein-ribulosamine 3-kinase